MKERSPTLQLLFVKNDSQSVEVEETEELNPSELLARLEQGDSVFITRKRIPQSLSPALRRARRKHASPRQSSISFLPS